MKRSYHTDIVVQYKLGLLPNEMLKCIPTSTLHNWKNRDIKQLFGCEYVHNFADSKELIQSIVKDKKLLKAAKALYFVYSTQTKLLKKFKNKNKIYREAKSLIVETIAKIEPALGYKKAFKLMGISPQQFYAWKNLITCKQSPETKCRKKSFSQLTLKETNIIKKYLCNEKLMHWRITSIYYKILKDGAAFFSMTTFYKYARLFMLTRVQPKKKKYATGIRATKPLSVLHMDVTIFRTLDNTKHYIYFIMDNYSRKILNYRISDNYNSTECFKNLKEAYCKTVLSNVKPRIDLIVDGGIENKGMVDNFINSIALNIKKFIAGVDIIQSNSMIEAGNRNIKYDYLFKAKIFNRLQLHKHLVFAVSDYNNKPHTAHYGLTPDEVCNGAIPNNNMFKDQIQKAKSERKAENLKSNCFKCF